MGFLKIWGRKKKQSGWIGAYDLGDWWNSNFSEEERGFITAKFKPMGQPESCLIEGDYTGTSQSIIGFLSSLAGWFSTKKNISFAYKILAKAESFLDDETDILDRHFLYSNSISLYYRSREHPDYYAKAIEACKSQISLSTEVSKIFHRLYQNQPLPSHAGYKQLAIVLEKGKRYQKAVDLCTEAQNEGWAGDWQKRINRCREKGAK